MKTGPFGRLEGANGWQDDVLGAAVGNPADEKSKLWIVKTILLIS
jgi:hypothetical protein